MICSYQQNFQTSSLDPLRPNKRRQEKEKEEDDDKDERGREQEGE